MKFGTSLYPFGRFPDLGSLVRYVQHADQLGYDYIDIPEHVIFPSADEQSMGRMFWDPVVLASHLADVTTSIRLNFRVIVLPQHNPLMLAKQLATLDWISNGRIGVGVGVGVGWYEEEFRMLGVDFRRRGTRAEEYIQAMKALWTTDPSGFQGQFVSFTGASFFPKPVQKPHPPIYIGGSAQTSAARAATLGDGWMPMTSTPESFQDGLAVLKRSLTEHGRTLDNFTIFKSLPLFQRSKESQEHLRMAKSEQVTALDGDYGKAIDHVEYCRELGVTNMTIIMPPDYDWMMRELPAFAEKVIHR